MTLSQPAFDTLKNQILYTDLLTLCGALPSQSVDMILCDPPYGDGKTKMKWDKLWDWSKVWTEFHRIIKPKGIIALFACPPFSAFLITSNLENYRYNWYWQKGKGANIGQANSQPMRVIEEICIFSLTRANKNQFTEEIANYYPQMEPLEIPYVRKRGGAGRGSAAITRRIDRIEPRTEGYPKNIIYESMDSDLDRGLHPTQKPVALFEYLIRTYTQPGELVLDPCIGSGTTAIAARQTGRQFIGGDITLEYVNIARARLAKPYTPPLFLDVNEAV